MRARGGLLFAFIALLGGLWAGAVRLGWALPTPQTLPGAHGPLMVVGFVGALISLERAVALRSRWGYLAPAFSVVGALAWAWGIALGAYLALGGSVVLAALYLSAMRQQRAWPIVIMGIGGVCWAIGNLLWALGKTLLSVVPWWGAFLVLTIAGERLEMARLRQPSPIARALFMGSFMMLMGGLALTLAHFDGGVRIFSAGMGALALWLLRYDVAWRTIRQRGLVRFIAVSLLVGYFWLGVAGVVGMLWGGQTAGLFYDAMWHALFVGFVFSMIFGHAPVIFPAVLKVRLPFTLSFYGPLALLHLSLALRILGDSLMWIAGRQWGGLLNALAILFFFANMARVALGEAILQRSRPR
jgi:hypothetical protein